MEGKQGLESFIDLLITFTLKILDNSLSTTKTIYLSKEKYMQGALFAAFSTFFYLMAMTRVLKSDSLAGIIAMCIATLLGTYLPGRLIKRSEKDKLYIFDITSNTIETGNKLADELRDANIAIRTELVYNSKMEKTLATKAYCDTREESKQVINALNSKEYKKSIKWHVYTPLELE